MGRARLRLVRPSRGGNPSPPRLLPLRNEIRIPVPSRPPATPARGLRRSGPFLTNRETEAREGCAADPLTEPRVSGRPPGRAPGSQARAAQPRGGEQSPGPGRGLCQASGPSRTCRLCLCMRRDAADPSPAREQGGSCSANAVLDGARGPDSATALQTGRCRPCRACSGRAYRLPRATALRARARRPRVKERREGLPRRDKLGQPPAKAFWNWRFQGRQWPRERNELFSGQYAGRCPPSSLFRAKHSSS